MSWIERARREHAAFQRDLVRSLPTVSVPVADSDYTAPGYLYYGHFFSCVPDESYPWNMHVLAAIREFCPDVMPVIIRSVWRNGDHGQMQEPFIITRHGLARAIRDPILPVHEFHCRMPSTPVQGLCIPGRSITDCRPNYVECEWYDPDDRPWGRDLPGAYLPFGWEFYAALRRCYEDGSKDLRVHTVMDEYRSNRIRRELSRKDDHRHRRKDFERHYNQEPSDVEWKQKYVGNW